MTDVDNRARSSRRSEDGPHAPPTRRPPLPLSLPPLRADRQPVGQARTTKSPRAAETSDGLRGIVLRVAWTATPADWEPPAGALRLRDRPKTGSVSGVAGVEASIPPADIPGQAVQSRPQRVGRPRTEGNRPPNAREWYLCRALLTYNRIL